MSGELVTTLECDHCGGVAVESESGLFGEDMASRCMSCGFPGNVSIQEGYEGDDYDDANEAYWLSSEDNAAVCNDLSCEACKEYRPMSELHVWSDGCDFVVAKDADDARAAIKEFIGEGLDGEGWEQLPDDQLKGIYCDADGKPCEVGTGKVRELTLGEWAKETGRGYLCTTQ